MATISEDYVSFETAKLLKDKGFDTAVRSYYQKIDDDITYHIEDFRNWNVYDMWYSMPTLQMAMKWLREVYYIHIAVDRGPKGYHLSIQTIPLGVVKYITREITGNTYVNSYEEAIEAAISYCLEKLI